MEDWEITLCPHATLTPKQRELCLWVLAELYRDDVARLYSRKELANYRAVNVLVEVAAERRIQASCFIAKPGGDQKPSAEYLQLIIRVVENLDFPMNYVEKLRRFLE